jgi:hypothetical protein
VASINVAAADQNVVNRKWVKTIVLTCRAIIVKQMAIAASLQSPEEKNKNE